MKTPTSTSAGRGLLRRVSAALFLLTTILGCVAPEDKGSGFNPPPDIAQLSVSPSSVNFTSQFGSAPPDETVDITGHRAVTGLGVGDDSLFAYVQLVERRVGARSRRRQRGVARPPVDLQPGTYTKRPVVSTVTGVVTAISRPSIISPARFSGFADERHGARRRRANPAADDNRERRTWYSLRPVGRLVKYGPGAAGWLTASLNRTTAPASCAFRRTSPGSPWGHTWRVPVSSSLPGITRTRLPSRLCSAPRPLPTLICLP